MPHEVWSLRYNHSPFKFVSFAPFDAFWVYSFQTKSNCSSICVNAIMSIFLMNTGIATIYICLHGKQFATLITVGTQFATVINFGRGIATVISAEAVRDRYNCQEVVCDSSLLKKSGILLLQLMEKLFLKKKWTAVLRCHLWSTAVKLLNYQSANCFCKNNFHHRYLVTS